MTVNTEKWFKPVESQNMSIIQHQELELGFKDKNIAIFAASEQYMCIYNGKNTISIYETDKPHLLLQQIELSPGQQITALCVVEQSPIIVIQLSSKHISVYFKQSSYFKEFTTLKENVDLITCISPLPVIKLYDHQYQSWVVFGTSNQDIYVLYNLNKHPTLKKILSLSDVPLNITVCAVPVSIIDEQGQGLVNNINGIQQTIILCIQTSQSVTFFLCKYWDSHIQAVKIGKRFKLEQQCTSQAIHSSFYYSKKDNQLHCFYTYDTLGTLVIFNNLINGSYYKSINTKIAFQENISLLNEQTILINLISSNFILIASQQGYNLIDIENQNKSEQMSNSDDAFAQMDDEISKTKIIQSGNYSICKSSKLSTNTFSKESFILSYNYNDQQYKLQILKIQSITQQISELKDIHCFCSLDLLIQITQSKHASFATYTDAFQNYEQKLTEITKSPEKSFCAVPEQTQTQCLNIITAQFQIGSQFYQALHVSIIDNEQDSQEVKQFIQFVTKVLIRISMAFNIMDGVILNINKLRPDQVQQYMKDTFLRQIIVTLTQKQLNIQPALLMEIITQTQLDQLSTHVRYYELIKSYIVLNTMNYSTLHQSIILIENEKLYRILPTAFILMIIGNQSYSQNQKDIVDQLFQMFVKYILINLNPDKKHEDCQMLSALSMIIQILLENDFQKLVNEQFVTKLIIDDIELNSLLDNIQQKQPIDQQCQLITQQYVFSSINSMQYQEITENIANKYFLPLFIHNQQMISLYKSKNFEYCISHSKYQEFIGALYNTMVKNTMMLQDKTSITVLHNTVTPYQQVKIYTLLIQNQYLNSKYQNFQIEIYKMIAGYVFKEDDVLDQLPPQGGKFIWILLQILKYQFQQHTRQIINYISTNQQNVIQHINQVQYVQYQKLQMNDIQNELLQLISVKQLVFMLEYVSNCDEIDKLIILGKHKQVIKITNNNLLINIQRSTNNMIETGLTYYILVVLENIVNSIDCNSEQYILISNCMFFFQYCIFNQYINKEEMILYVNQIIQSQQNRFSDDELNIFKAMLADLQGRTIQCAQYLIAISPSHALQYLLHIVITNCKQNSGESGQIYYSRQKQLQITLNTIFEQLHSQIQLLNDSELLYQLMQYLIILYKYNFGDCLEVLNKESYQKIQFSVICTIIAPQHIKCSNNAYDYCQLQELFFCDIDKTYQNFERMFLCINENNSITNNIYTYLPIVLQSLTNNLEYSKLFKVFDNLQLILMHQKCDIAIEKFIQLNQQNVFPGMYLLQISQQCEKSMQVFQKTFESILQQDEEQLIPFVEKSMQIYILHNYSDQWQKDLFSFLQLSNLVSNQIIREQIIRILIGLYQRSLSGDVLCEILCKFYENHKWEDIRGVLVDVIDQMLLQHDLQQEILQIAKGDLQRCYLRHNTQLKCGAIVELNAENSQLNEEKYSKHENDEFKHKYSVKAMDEQ